MVIEKNTVYYIKWDGSYTYIMLTGERTNQDFGIHIEAERYFENVCFSGHSEFTRLNPKHSIRRATPAEERHLRACIAAKKWIDAPKEEIINHYEIY
ncbi:MAG: hypothetical protein E6R13_08235 [Spirochaetes bacterium]|nr:MAG: hypothetical protein E6R13_08235 [Spirochaetota bacterium]